MAHHAVDGKGNRIVTDILVFGYMRLEGKTYNVSIPDEIMRLCFSFWFLDVCDVWSKAQSCSCYTIDGPNAELINLPKDKNEFWMMSAFGTQSVSQGIFEWKIRFKTAIQWICMWIIFDDEEVIRQSERSNSYSFNEGEGCCLLNSLGNMYHHACNYGNCGFTESFQDKDTLITMTLDMDKHSISYKINDKDYGVGYDGLYKDKYRLAVTMCISYVRSGDGLELL